MIAIMSMINIVKIGTLPSIMGAEDVNNERHHRHHRFPMVIISSESLSSVSTNITCTLAATLHLLFYEGRAQNAMLQLLTPVLVLQLTLLSSLRPSNITCQYLVTKNNFFRCLNEKWCSPAQNAGTAVPFPDPIPTANLIMKLQESSSLPVGLLHFHLQTWYLLDFQLVLLQARRAFHKSSTDKPSLLQIEMSVEPDRRGIFHSATGH